MGPGGGVGRVRNAANAPGELTSRSFDLPGLGLFLVDLLELVEVQLELEEAVLISDFRTLWYGCPRCTNPSPAGSGFHEIAPANGLRPLSWRRRSRCQWIALSMIWWTSFPRPRDGITVTRLPATSVE